MEKKMYPGIDQLSKEERLELLKNAACEIGEEKIKRFYTAQEIEDFKHDLSEETIVKLDKEDELKVISAPLKQAIKEKTLLIKEVTKKIRTKYDETLESVYYTDDHINFEINAWDGMGVWLYSRPMNQRERQTRLKIAN